MKTPIGKNLKTENLKTEIGTLSAFLRFSISALLIFALPLLVLAQTNDVPVPEVPAVSTNSVPAAGPLKPVLDLLPSNLQDLINKVIMWIGSFSLVLAPFAVWIRHKLSDMLNTAAESSETDDDEWLRKLFGNPIYSFLATMLRFLHVNLPVLSDLERAILQQRQAVAESKGLPLPTTDAPKP